MELRFRTIRTALGFAGFVASARGLRRVYLPSRTLAGLKRMIHRDVPAATEDSWLMPELAQALQRYFSGQKAEFAVRFDWNGASAFEQDVWHACRQIGYGQTRSYKELAEQLGRPGGARAVGLAMRRNPCPIVIPCHRVVCSDGSLGGFSVPGGARVKRRLLEMEAALQPARTTAN